MVVPCCGGTSTLLAVWVPEEVRLASGALSPDDVWLALALTSDGSALRALRTRAVAVAVQSTLVEVRSQGDHGVLAETIHTRVDAEKGSGFCFDITKINSVLQVNFV